MGFLFFLLVLVRGADERHLAHRDVRVHRAGRRGLVAQEGACSPIIGVVVVAGIFVNLGYNGLSFIEPLGAGTSAA